MANRDAEFVKIWRAPGVAGVELYSACLKSFTYAKHFHGGYAIGINDAGLGAFDYQGAKRLAGPQSINLVMPGEVHTGGSDSEDGWTYRNIYFDNSVFLKAAENCGLSRSNLPHFREPVLRHAELWARVDRLFSVLRDPPTMLASEVELFIFLTRVLTRYATQHTSDKRVGRENRAVLAAHSFLEANYADDISLETLSAEAGISPFHLVRSFRQRFGLPPHAYQIQLRLNMAKTDLRLGKQITEVALTHGFYDQSHFHRQFKRAFGVTPGAYRTDVTDAQ